MPRIEERLRKLEAAHKPDSLIVDMIIGGFGEGRAEAGSLRWERDPSEPHDEFVRRVTTEARAAGETHLIIGGLPDL